MTPRRKAGYMISAVAEIYGIHPQTLRLYEKAGLLRPSRSEGNTRLYIEADLRRLESILTLTRDMGVNLAGVEVILNMREKMEALQREMAELVEFIRLHAGPGTDVPPNALVRVPSGKLVRTTR